MFQKIIFLCTGNICRSPIAEGVAKKLLPSREISSLGTGALLYHPADPLAQQVAAAHGIDIQQHRARQATELLLKPADLILALDQGHLDWVTTRFPFLRGRAHKLGKWSKNEDVPDPYRRPIEAFEAAYLQIERHIGEWIEKF